MSNRLDDDGMALIRIAADLRKWIADAHIGDSDARAIRDDCDIVERIGKWLSTAAPIDVTQDISATDEIPSIKQGELSKDATLEWLADKYNMQQDPENPSGFCISYESAIATIFGKRNDRSIEVSSLADDSERASRGRSRCHHGQVA